MKKKNVPDKLDDQALHNELVLYRMMVNAALDSITLIDRNYIYRIVNNAYLKIRQIKRDEVLNHSVAEVWGQEVFDQIIKKKLDDCFDGKHVSHVSAYEFNKDQIDYIETNYTPCFNSTGEVAYAVVVSRNVTELKKSQIKAKFLAHYDSITNLPSRPLFKNRLNHEIKRAKREAKLLAVLILDLDEFKKINATFGHSAGDELLVCISERLKKYLRKSDTIGRPGGIISSAQATSQEHFSRIGGDEFTLIIPDLPDQNYSTSFAEKIISLFDDPFQVGDQEIFISTSIGIALYPESGESSEDLLKNADTAMYRAKEVGKNTFRYYCAEMNEQAQFRIDLESKMRHAINNQEFLLYYQPQYNIETHELVGMEALIRWDSPEMGLVSPGTFIPLAEETGMIIPIGKWVIEAACYQGRIWYDSGFSDLHLGANLSMRQFFDPSLVADVKAVIEKTGFNPRFLELEITETSMMHDTNRAIQILNKLKEIGINISLDDFGTGYSSLIYLKNFHTDTLKIDQAFIRNADLQGRDGAIISSIIDMCYKLGIKVVAEGVETKESLEFLKNHSCHIAQGYFFDRPLPVEDFHTLLKKEKGG